jgi:hypothetical protein
MARNANHISLVWCPFAIHCILSSFNKAFSIASNGRMTMNDDVERMWKMAKIYNVSQPSGWN